MFKINDSVIHCREGLSTIVAMNSMNGKDYFLVSVNRNSGETIYVPVDTASSIIRPLMNKKDADELLLYIKKIKKEFNPNTKQRRDGLKRRLGSGEVKDIAFLFKQLYLYKTLKDGSVKFGPVDLDMLEYASNNLLDELSISYNKPRDQIEAFIYNKLK